MTDPAAPSTGAVTEQHLKAYLSALQSHDWAFEYSDDSRVWNRGRESLEALREAQRLIDPDGMIWNQYAPDAYRFKLAEGAPS